MDKNEIFNNIFSRAGFEPGDKQVSQFNRFYELMVEWNRNMNLTGITDYEEVLLKHYVDSLMIGKLPVEVFNENRTLIDIGTGAGFPGIPIKIMYPGIRCVLLDSLQKRIGFINCVIEELGLKDITAVHGRAEEFVAQGNREQFDICVSRAVADLSVLSELCLPYVRTGGFFVPYKSGHCKEELQRANNAIDILGGSLSDTYEFELSPGADKRVLVMIHKQMPTPEKYPRRAARIMKNPL